MSVQSNSVILSASDLSGYETPQLAHMLANVTGKGQKAAKALILAAIDSASAPVKKARVMRKGRGTKAALRSVLESGESINAQEFADEHDVSVVTIRTHLSDLQNAKYCGKDKEPLSIYRIGKAYKALLPEDENTDEA